MATPIDKFLIIHGAYSGLSDEGRGVVQRVNSVIPEILGESGLTVGFSGVGHSSSMNKSLISEIFDEGMIHALPGNDTSRGTYYNRTSTQNPRIVLSADIFNEGHGSNLNARFFTALKTTMHEIGHAASQSTGALGETSSVSTRSMGVIINDILDPYTSEMTDSSRRGLFSFKRKSGLSLSVNEIKNIQRSYGDLVVSKALEEARAEGFAYEALSRIGSSFELSPETGLIIPSYSKPAHFSVYEQLDTRYGKELVKNTGTPRADLNSLLTNVFERFASPDVMREIEGPLSGMRGLSPERFVKEMTDSSRLSGVGTIHGGLRRLSDEGFTQLFEQVNYRPADAMERYFEILVNVPKEGKLNYSPEKIMGTIMEASDTSFDNNRRVLLGDPSSVPGSRRDYLRHPMESVVGSDDSLAGLGLKKLDVESGRMSSKTFQMVADSVKTAIRVRT